MAVHSKNRVAGIARLILTTMCHLKIIFGTALQGKMPFEEMQDYLDILNKRGIRDIDTAHRYVSQKADHTIRWRF